MVADIVTISASCQTIMVSCTTILPFVFIKGNHLAEFNLRLLPCFLLIEEDLSFQIITSSSNLSHIDLYAAVQYLNFSSAATCECAKSFLYTELYKRKQKIIGFSWSSSPLRILRIAQTALIIGSRNKEKNLTQPAPCFYLHLGHKS